MRRGAHCQPVRGRPQKSRQKRPPRQGLALHRQPGRGGAGGTGSSGGSSSLAGGLGAARRNDLGDERVGELAGGEEEAGGAEAAGGLEAAAAGADEDEAGAGEANPVEGRLEAQLRAARGRCAVREREKKRGGRERGREGVKERE